MVRGPGEFPTAGGPPGSDPTVPWLPLTAGLLAVALGGLLLARRTGRPYGFEATPTLIRRGTAARWFLSDGPPS